MSGFRWPWVSREQYEVVSRTLADRETVLANVRHQYDALLERYVEAVAPKAPAPVAPKLKDLVIEAVRTRAGNNGALRAMLGQYARTQRAGDADDETIIEAILHWKSNDDDGVT